MTAWLTRNSNWCLLLIFLISIPIKLAAAQEMPFDIDYVPVLARGYDWLQGGPFPAYGTLSSVAAYNMPMLAWLHLPALALTQDGYLTILLTMLSFNLISIATLYRLGTSMFDVRVGLIAATLFAFSASGISSAYIAWAQQLLPGFFALVLLCLWEWHAQQRGIFLALAGILATAAFMTHFSAVLLFPAMLVFALLTRARWQWRWLIIGAIGSLLLLAPYLHFQVERDFADLRAFLNETPLVGEAIMAEYAYLKPGAGPLPFENGETLTPPENAEEEIIVSPQASTTAPRWQRALDLALRTPGQIIERTNMGFTHGTTQLAERAPSLALVASGVQMLWQALFWIVGVGALSQTLRTWWQQGRKMGVLLSLLTHTDTGRIILLLVFNYTVVLGFVLTRNMDQPTYFMGLQMIQWLLVAYGLYWLVQFKWLRWSVLVLLIAHISFNMSERALRLITYDDTVHSNFNVSIYRHISGVSDAIAADWDSPDRVTIQYDIVPEMRTLWWIAPWSHTDPNYRYGWNFDFLLELEHGISNTNLHPLGQADNPDYIVVYEPGLSRWDLTEYDLMQVGTIYILKPKGE